MRLTGADLGGGEWSSAASGWGTGISAGGHLGRRFEIEASDNLLEDGGDRVVRGTVPGEVAKKIFTLRTTNG